MGKKLFQNCNFHLEESWGVVVDVLNDDGQSSRGRFGWNTIINGQNPHLMTWSDFTVQTALNGDDSVLIDGKLTTTIRGSINSE